MNLKILQNLSSSYRHVPTQKGGNTWDVLCLKITEQITDSNIRCRAILEIAVGTVPPWNNQLSTVVKNILSQEEKIDPKLFVFNLKKYTSLFSDYFCCVDNVLMLTWDKFLSNIKFRLKLVLN